MSKILTAILFLAICLIPSAAFAAAEEISSSDLIDKAKEYSEQSVSYTGEVIGDIMPRGEYTWINISDGSNAVGIWVKSADLPDIRFIGRYDAHGDTLKVTGVFHRACAEHGGDFDIHAHKIEVIKTGYTTPHALDLIKVVIACVLFIAALICIIFVLKKNIKPRRMV